MSSRSKRRRYLRSVIEAAQADLAALDQPPHQPPPPITRAPIVATAGQPSEKRLWHFQHTHPQLPGILYCVVQAADIANARGAAYLLAEQFTQNVIGFLKANHDPHLPDRAA